MGPVRRKARGPFPFPWRRWGRADRARRAPVVASAPARAGAGGGESPAGAPAGPVLARPTGAG